jgi:hypothetical protein
MARVTRLHAPLDKLPYGFLWGLFVLRHILIILRMLPNDSQPGSASSKYRGVLLPRVKLSE